MSDLPRFMLVALVLIRRDDTVLLVQQRDPPGYWSLPGGVVEYGESPDRAAIREVKEETGLDVCLKRVVGIYAKPADDALAITFEGEITGGVMLQTTNETLACRYFPTNQLPDPIRDHLRQRVQDLDAPAVVWRTQ